MKIVNKHLLQGIKSTRLSNISVDFSITLFIYGGCYFLDLPFKWFIYTEPKKTNLPTS